MGRVVALKGLVTVTKVSCGALLSSGLTYSVSVTRELQPSRHCKPRGISSMAQLNLTFDQHVALLALLKHSDVHPYVNHDPGLKEVLDGLEGLSFKVRTCPVCDTEFEVVNPRKKTCSDACRQALSRSKCDPKAIRKRQSTVKREALLEAHYKRRSSSTSTSDLLARLNQHASGK